MEPSENDNLTLPGFTENKIPKEWWAFSNAVLNV